MKLIIRFLLLYHFMLPVQANNVCPETLTALGEKFSPPSHWHVTLKKLTPNSAQLLFYIAIHNYDHTNLANGNRISCLYEDRKNESSIELTSDDGNIAKPDGALWKALDETSSYCFPNTPLKAAECGWGST